MDMLLVFVNIILFIALAPFFEGVIRKLTAKVQSRQGPPVVQPYYDIIKLLGKESITPGNWAFKLAPLMALASIITAIALVPLGFRATALTQYGDVITVIYLLTLGSIAILLGALSSKNTYAIIGASREMATIILVEPVLAMTFIVGAVKARSLGIDASMFSLSSGGYGWASVLMMVVFILALQAFVGRQPFDTTEAEIEILEGPFIEYSGPNYALFKLYVMMKQMFYGLLFVTVFIPFFKTGYYGVDVAIQLVEVFAVTCFIGLVGATNPRLRIDQAVKYYVVLVALSLTAVGMSFYGI
ncbi:MAG TPA: NADH-quinone oxidoreductase subunit H [Spirochaetota bacterium]|mgnify:CR=1 FL=1|nr:NADH-quinone oxidoreductase subunit H [Spirochaetota bacterium]HPJ37251.1 NADH-quinone oxidoreductase subunit H [Spirochaetota bacterium]HPQ53348.1 NADH-quinone oxidoreductase subunit H [Spirochaetota bacterium]